MNVERSMRAIGMEDLERLAELAKHDLSDFFSRYPSWRKSTQDGSYVWHCVKGPRSTISTAPRASRISTSGPSFARIQRNRSRTGDSLMQISVGRSLVAILRTLATRADELI